MSWFSPFTERGQSQPRLGPREILAQSPDGKYMLVTAGSQAGRTYAQVLDVAGGRLLSAHPVEQILAHGHGYWRFCWDGSRPSCGSS